jgi:P-type Ca2+ transporter type 2C
MATFHRMSNARGEPVIRCFVKGAPDVLIARGGSYWTPGDQLQPVTDDNRALALKENERMAQSGERVMVVGRRDFDPATFDPTGDLLGLVNELTLLAMVGIVDPPRPEAKAAIAKCKSARIQVRMITGDHAVTAAAIAHELGITGEALTGAQFSAMGDEQVTEQLDKIGVVARVAPEDKIRLVRLLQRKRNIVAMTGDGVNDAPALKKADIGVAMGVTGTEVSKDAAVMILTDDNFATIVKAVEYGRGLYDNLTKYLRFQMVALVGFIASFLGAAIFNIAGGIPFSTPVVLWINFAIDVPLAIAMGLDTPASDLMERKPRAVNAPVISRASWVHLTFLGTLMAAGALLTRWYVEPVAGAVVANTMSMTAFSLATVAVALSVRDETRSALNRDIFRDRRQLGLYGLTLAFILLITGLRFMQGIFDTTSLTGGQWLICIAVALTILAVDEVIKFVLRRIRGGGEAPVATPSAAPETAAGLPMPATA